MAHVEQLKKIVPFGPVVNVVIGVHIVVLFVPLVVVHLVVLILLVVILYQFIPLLSRSHFSHVFTVFSRHLRCGIHILKIQYITEEYTWQNFWTKLMQSR